MKRQFLGRLLSLFLVGTVVAGVGCKDYDDDITSLNNRIDELTTGQIASGRSRCSLCKMRSTGWTGLIRA